MQQLFALIAIFALLTSSMAPAFVFAQATTTDNGTGATTEETKAEDGTTEGSPESGGSTGTEEATTTENGVESTDTGAEGDTATSTEETATSTDTGETSTSTEETATSTDSGTDGGTGESTEGGGSGGTGEGDGTDGSGDSTDGETATTTDGNTEGGTPGEGGTGTTTPSEGDGADGSTGTTTDEDGGDTGTSGESGDSGEEGSDGETGESPDDMDSNPIPVVTENDIGAEGSSADEDDEFTGGVKQTGRNITITTGNATARGELATDVNSNNIRSEIGTTSPNDFDTYTFNATGTNEATVENSATILSYTGDNTALSTGVSEIYTGNAVSALNIANVVNSNIVNSEGFLYLSNRELDAGQSLDLTDFFFPDPDSTFAAAGDCDLLSCAAEDVIYNFSQSSDAIVTNDATVSAITGENVAEGDYMKIETGDAFGAANVVNVVNTNIIDSNYRLLTMNAIGDLNGDLMLPTQELFNAFYSRPNGMSRAESAEDIYLTIENTNGGFVENNVETYAETGLNDSSTVLDSLIKTGAGESESNILNKVNTNIYGGDVMYLLIKVHGYWSGDVLGLPDGLSWMWTSDGVLIYNTDAEIAPSAILPYDADSYTANITDMNNATVTNNINIDAISGDSSIEGLAGGIETGDAFASANVMNIVNTNVIGVNWTMAVINIFGDFDGNVTFSETNLALDGEISSADNPLGPGGLLSYTYSVTNNSQVTATNVTLTQTLQSAYTTASTTQQIVTLGSIAPGETVETTLDAVVDSGIGNGTTSVIAVASVDSDESDSDESDNASLLTIDAINSTGGTGSTTGDTGTTTSDDLGTTTDDGTGTTTDDGSGDAGTTGDEEGVVVNTNNGGGGGGGGGGGSSKKKKKLSDVEAITETTELDRSQIEIDPSVPPHLIVSKVANIDDGDLVVSGQEINYTITVLNQGGGAYDATVFDILTNEYGSEVSSQSWDLGTILPGEQIKLHYTTAYSEDTPSGVYTNTAYVEAYRLPGMKKDGEDPLKLEDATHTIKIDGVDLAVGNVDVIAYFPGTNGSSNALISWETSKPSQSQIFYSPKGLISPYNPDAANLGYQSASFEFPEEKTRHFMILTGLRNGIQYTYRVFAKSGEFTATGGDYTFTVPGAVTGLTLAIPGLLPTNQVPQVAGASVTTPVPTKIPTPTPVIAPPPPPAPKPVSTPEPEPEPKPIPEPEQKEEAGFFKKAVGKVFGFFK